VSELVERLRTALARRYVIEQELGRGGMATVYAALDKRHDRRVALKVFPPELAAAIGPERFKREIAITSRLTHPHILALHDSGEAAGALYYVMPLVEGESLSSKLERSPEGLSIEETVAIGRQIADALAHAHKLGVVHRDVTPQNILLADGHALLADFGIARLLEGEGITESGLPLGTAMYRSPEQAAGHVDVDGRSDIYSLGCVLYESLLGEQAAPNLSNRFAKPVTPLRKLKTAIPIHIESAIARAMSSNPADRFATASDFSKALAEQAIVTRQRKRVPQLVAIAAAAVLVAVTGFTILRTRAVDPVAKRVLVSRFENRTGDPSLDVLGEMAADYVARGLAETRLVEVIDGRTESPGDATLNKLRGPARNIAVAQMAGAGTMVAGSYYRNGDTLHFETQIVDAKSGKLIMSPEPAIGSLGDRMTLVDRVRQRLMAGFAATIGPGFEAWQAQSIPPTFDAYREMLAGQEETWRFEWPEAIKHFRRASEMDSSYMGARTSMLLAAALGLQCRLVDSLAQHLDPIKAQLAAIDRGQLEWGEAHCRGDWDASLTAGRAVRAAAPRSIAFNILLGITALELFRPREALSVLQSFDAEHVPLAPAQRSASSSFIILAYHELGDARSELETSRKTMSSLPDNPHMRIAELLSLGELRRYRELRQRRDAWFKRTDLMSNGVFTPAIVNLCVGPDPRAHGSVAESQAFVTDAADWYNAHAAVQEKGPPEVPCTKRLLAPIYYLKRWDEAAALYSRMLAADSTSELAHEGLGATAAHRNDRAEAGRIEQWLATHPSRELGRSTYARARIAALLGDADRALTLLQQSFDEGLVNRMYIHTDPDLESLQDRPAYRRLLALTG
jgi:TolB-like protein